MEKLKRIFDREYNEALKDGDNENRAIYWAIDWIETGVINARTRFDYEKFKETYADYYAIYEAKKLIVEKEKEQKRVDDLKNNSVVAYHPVGSTFNVKTNEGLVKLKVIEQGSCRGCFFSKVTGYAQSGYFTFGCKYDYVNKNAYCSEEMREDRKKVIY